MKSFALTLALALITTTAQAADTWDIPQTTTPTPHASQPMQISHCTNYTLSTAMGGAIEATCLKNEATDAVVRVALPGIAFNRVALIHTEGKPNMLDHCQGLTVTPVANGLQISGYCQTPETPLIKAEITVPGFDAPSADLSN